MLHHDRSSGSRRQFLSLVAAFAAVPVGAATRPIVGRVERLDPALDRLIDADAPVEEVMTGFEWSEGPVWIGGPRGMLLVSDPRANVIRSFREAGGSAAWLKPSGYAGADPARLREPGSNGLFLGRGGLIVADSGNRRLTRIDLASRRKSVIVDRFEGRRFNSPNDLCVSPRDGAIFFTDPPYGLAGIQNSPDREMDYTGVFRVSRDGKVALLGKYNMPNGIAISPDGGTLFHTDRTIGWVAHRLDGSGRSVSERAFVDLAGQGVTPSGDSMKMDRDGNLWTSSSDGLSIFSPDAKRIGIIRVDDIVSNCEIGADGYLYMTTNHRVTRVRVKARKLPVPASF